ncbi:hypothetical protein, partial [Marinospirillum insulare]|uniref:hypothetical protein n=1 Tax=Marinospirillum insulare TaxID=217169 RepID=UPI0024E18220
MQIECPSCSTGNKIEFAQNIVCCECKKSFAGHFYKKFKKPLISATTALFIGAFGTYKVEQVFFEDQRYPLKVEYELIDSCVNASRTRFGSSSYIKKTWIQLASATACNSSNNTSFGVFIPSVFLGRLF